MADFFNAALPFVAMGLTIALLAANGRRGRKNYLTEGMCLGRGPGGRASHGAGPGHVFGDAAGGGPGPAGAQRREGI